jgi:hypothetical protein
MNLYILQLQFNLQNRCNPSKRENRQNGNQESSQETSEEGREEGRQESRQEEVAVRTTQKATPKGNAQKAFPLVFLRSNSINCSKHRLYRLASLFPA